MCTYDTVAGDMQDNEHRGVLRPVGIQSAAGSERPQQLLDSIVPLRVADQLRVENLHRLPADS